MNITKLQDIAKMIAPNRNEMTISKEKEEEIINSLIYDNLEKLTDIIEDLTCNNDLDIDVLFFYFAAKSHNAQKCLPYLESLLPEYFFSVSLLEESQGNMYTPRIPEIRAAGENDTIARICVSDNLSGCVSAVPWGGAQFDELLIDESYSSRSYPILLHIFKREDIILDNMVSPTELYREDLVRDAVINREYWITNQDIKAFKSVIIEVDDFYEEIEDDIAYEDTLKPDFEENYEDYLNGVFTKIILHSDTFRVLPCEKMLVGDTISIDKAELFKDVIIVDVAPEYLVVESVETAINNALVMPNDILSIDNDEDTITIYLSSPATFNKDKILEAIINEMNF